MSYLRFAIYLLCLIYSFYSLLKPETDDLYIKKWACEGTINRLDFRDSPTGYRESGYWVRIYVKGSKVRVCELSVSENSDKDLYKKIRAALPYIHTNNYAKANCISSNLQDYCHIKDLSVDGKLLADTPEDIVIKRVESASHEQGELKHILSWLIYFVTIIGALDTLIQLDIKLRKVKA